MEIKKLSPELLDDWLYFFDNVAFCDNGEWEGCYCMCYHWNDELDSIRGWNCSKSEAAFNRKCAVDFIKSGKMQGYLAYENGKVIGWCNANDKSSYDNVNFSLPYGDFDRKHRVKCIMCFCIAPDERGKGVASSILEKVCADAALEGYDYIEVYPFIGDENNAYHGPKSMYIKHGFKEVGQFEWCCVLRYDLSLKR